MRSLCVRAMSAALFLLFVFLMISLARAEEEQIIKPPLEEALLGQKIAECPYLKNVFGPNEKWAFSSEKGMLYANLVKGSKTFVFGYRPEEKRDWGEHLPRWYFAVGSMELGLVIASFSGVVKDGKYIVNNLACISKKCKIQDIHASIGYNGFIEQISIDENCDKFFDKVYTVSLKPDANYAGKEPWAQAARSVSDNLNRLVAGNW